MPAYGKYPKENSSVQCGYYSIRSGFGELRVHVQYLSMTVPFIKGCLNVIPIEIKLCALPDICTLQVPFCQITGRMKGRTNNSKPVFDCETRARPSRMSSKWPPNDCSLIDTGGANPFHTMNKSDCHRASEKLRSHGLPGVERILVCSLTRAPMQTLHG